MSKIVNIRGTSGSGKSYIVRSLMSRYQQKTPVTTVDRRQPWGYRLIRPEGSPLFVLGHYETACGGGDTITDIETVYHMVNTNADAGFDVIFEGLIIASDVKRCVDLKNRHTLMVIELNTPLEQCIESIQERRQIKANEGGKEPKAITSKTIETAKKKMVGVHNQGPRFRDAGVDFRNIDRDEAMSTVLHMFGWSE